MTLYQFKLLNADEQYLMLSSLNAIATRSYTECLFELYQHEDFYIEVKVNYMQKTIRTFKTTDLLEPYLTEMVLPKLI
jgi:hypothetical protein